MGILIVAVVLGAIPGGIAKNKGYNFPLWWLYGTVLFIVALPHSIALKDKVAPVDGRFLKMCPRCAETVKEAALMCRFCGYEFGASPAPVSSTRVGFALPDRSGTDPITRKTDGRDGRYGRQVRR